MVTLVRFQGELFPRLDLFLLQLLDLTGKDDGSVHGRVDTVGLEEKSSSANLANTSCSAPQTHLDGNNNVAALFQEHVGVHGNDTSLVGLRNIRKHSVDHANEHPVLLRVPCVLDNRDNVRPLLGNVDKVTARTVREFDGVDETGGSDNVRDVTDRGARGRAKVQDLVAGLDPDVVQTAEDTGGKLGSEGVPDAVFGLGSVGVLPIARTRSGPFELLPCVAQTHLDADPLFTVDTLAGHQVLGDEQVLLAAGHKDALVPVRLHDDLGASPATAPAAPSAARRSTTTAASTAAS